MRQQTICLESSAPPSAIPTSLWPQSCWVPVWPVALVLGGQCQAGAPMLHVSCRSGRKPIFL